MIYEIHDKNKSCKECIVYSKGFTSNSPECSVSGYKKGKWGCN